MMGKHTRQDHAFMHTTCIRRSWPHPGPVHSLDLGPPHTGCLQVQAKAEEPPPGAWGISKATLKWYEQCPLPQQLQELRKELWGQQPTLVCAPLSPNASRDTCAQGAPGFLPFSSFYVAGQGIVYYAHSPASPRPQQRCGEGAPPLHLSPLGSRAPVGMRGWARLWLSPGASGGGCCLGG